MSSCTTSTLVVIMPDSSLFAFAYLYFMLRTQAPQKEKTILVNQLWHLLTREAVGETNSRLFKLVPSSSNYIRDCGHSSTVFTRGVLVSVCFFCSARQERMNG